MTAVYFVWVLFILSSNFEGNALAVPSLGCQSVATAVLKNSFWTFNRDQKILQLILPTSNPNEVPHCFCDPAVDELGDVTRINLINSKTGILSSNQVCSGCPGEEEVADGDVRFSLDSADENFGPCDRIAVYRCRCTKSSIDSKRTEVVPREDTFPRRETKDYPVYMGDYYGLEICEFPEDNANTYDCGVSNPCGTYRDYTLSYTPRFPGNKGPSSFVQCEYYNSQCNEYKCPNNSLYAAVNCTCESQ